jgi:hypothetical protein
VLVPAYSRCTFHPPTAYTNAGLTSQSIHVSLYLVLGRDQNQSISMGDARPDRRVRVCCVVVVSDHNSVAVRGEKVLVGGWVARESNPEPTD